MLASFPFYASLLYIITTQNKTAPPPFDRISTNRKNNDKLLTQQLLNHIKLWRHVSFHHQHIFLTSDHHIPCVISNAEILPAHIHFRIFQQQFMHFSQNQHVSPHFDRRNSQLYIASHSLRYPPFPRLICVYIAPAGVPRFLPRFHTLDYAQKVEVSRRRRHQSR